MWRSVWLRRVVLLQVYAEAVATAAAASERSLAALQQEMLGVAAAVVGADLARAR
jgi:hypothetical protein